jgi:hypothetical protein
MSPLDIAAFAAPISFIIAIFSGLSGMAVDAVTDLAIFSLVQLIMAAEAGAAAMEGAKRVVTAKIRRFIQISLESAGHSGSPKTNCCKIGFKENYPLPSHSWSSPCCSRALGMCSSCIYARSHQSPEGAPKCDHRVRRATRWLKTNVIGFIAAPQMEMASSRSFSP